MLHDIKIFCFTVSINIVFTKYLMFIDRFFLLSTQELYHVHRIDEHHNHDNVNVVTIVITLAFYPPSKEMV